MKRLRRTFRPFSPGRTAAVVIAAAILAICTFSNLASSAQDDRQKAARLIKETVAGASSSAEAAARLMRAAVMLTDTPAIQADFCRKAYEYGTKTPSGQIEALAAIEILIRLEPKQADQWSEKRISVYRRMYAGTKPDKKRQAAMRIVRLTEELADAKAAKNQWPDALKFYTSAMRTAISLKLGDRTDLAHRIRQANANANRAKHFELLKKKLKAEPDNENTRNEIIELCLLEYDSPALAF